MMTYFQNTVAISLLSFWQAHFKNTYIVQTEPQSDTASHTASTQWTVTENNKAAPRLEATEMRLTLLFIIRVDWRSGWILLAPVGGHRLFVLVLYILWKCFLVHRGLLHVGMVNPLLVLSA